MCELSVGQHVFVAFVLTSLVLLFSIREYDSIIRNRIPLSSRRDVDEDSSMGIMSREEILIPILHVYHSDVPSSRCSLVEPLHISDLTQGPISRNYLATSSAFSLAITDGQETGIQKPGLGNSYLASAIFPRLTIHYQILKSRTESSDIALSYFPRPVCLPVNVVWLVFILLV